ncbi:hypothetical protein [uncultured Hymenobacter sp.]|uniref:hypothetical protein n=1 Tax=uncultured Hymenobacter sp. TaxID=170016 RepID=UPI0035CBD582
MKDFSIFLRSITLSILIISAQACTKEETAPIAASADTISDAKLTKETESEGNTVDGSQLETRREKTLSQSSEKKPDKTGEVSRTLECYDYWDVYYNTYTGEIVGREYVGRECSGGDYGGGGGDGGGGGGGSGSGGGTSGTSFPNGIYDELATVQQTTPTLGNYAATLRLSPNTYQVINVKVELNTVTKDLKKIVVTLNGVTWLTKVTQVGDGTLTKYNATTDTYSFQVGLLKEVGGVWSTTKTIYGTISPTRGVGTLTIP